MRPALAASALALIAAPLAAAPSTSTFQTITEIHLVDDKTQADEIRFRKDMGGRMTVPVRVVGRGPWRFLVDTGADRTTISSDLASSLRLQSGEPAEIHSVTAVHTVETATVPHLQLSKSEIHNLNAPLLKASDMGADGILGVDSLRSQRVMFDFDKNLMSIVPSRDRDIVSDPEAIVVYGKLRNGRLVLTNAVAEDSDVTVVLDTGSDVCIGNMAMKQKLEQRHALRTSGEVDLLSVTGEKLHGSYSIVRKLKMGNVTLSNVVVVFADARIFRDLTLQDRPAVLLGMNAMRAFKKVSIDFEHKKFRVLLPESGSLDATMMAVNGPAGPIGARLR